MGEEARCGGWVGEGVADVCAECVCEEGEVERCDVCVGDEDVGVGGEISEEGVCDVVVEVESAVNAVSAEDGDLVRRHGYSDVSRSYARVFEAKLTGIRDSPV